MMTLWWFAMIFTLDTGHRPAPQLEGPYTVRAACEARRILTADPGYVSVTRQCFSLRVAPSTVGLRGLTPLAPHPLKPGTSHPTP